MGASMNQEEKDLLLKDLCARLPYGVKCQIDTGDTDVYVDTLGIITIDGCVCFLETIDTEDVLGYGDIKPYLFPLSSLTKEQRNIISNKIREIQINNSPFGEIHDSGTDNLLNNITLCTKWLINYYNENHIDYNNLIEKGLAIDATSLNIY